MSELKIINSEILKTSSVKSVQELLTLFSVKSLREKWSDFHGSKAQIALSAIGTKDWDNILSFIINKFGTCKQHNYIYSHDLTVKTFPKITVVDADLVAQKISDESAIMYFVAKVKYKVIMWNPQGLESVHLLMPFSIEIIDGYLILRFITFEKNLDSYYGHSNHHIIEKSLDEKSFQEKLRVAASEAKIELAKADLHKGVKKLVETDKLGAIKAKIEKGKYTSTAAMNGEFEIKNDAPEVYEEYKKNTVHNSIYKCKIDEEFSVRNFSADLREGTIDFPSYGEREGDTEYVIKEILKYN